MTDAGNEAMPWQPKMRRQTPRWVLSFTFLLLAVTGTIPTASPQQLDRNSAAKSHAPKYDDRLTQYRAFRRVHASNEKFSHEGWLEAWTEFDERGFRFEIVSERGSEYMLNKVLRPMLKREQEIVAEGGPSRAALTDENYEFTAPELADGIQYVGMKPKRKDVVLVEGRMVLTPDGSDVLRIEGKLAKNPSFWTSLVNVIRRFARLDGVRVPVSTQTIANVKFAGQSRLDVTYEYESINHRRLSMAARQVIASARAAQ